MQHITESHKTRLALCPECRGKAECQTIDGTGLAGAKKPFYFVICSACGFGLLKAFRSRERAQRFWNQRCLVLHRKGLHTKKRHTV